LVKNLGLSVALARVVTIVTIPETTFASVWRHELRWARTIRTLIPLTFAGSASQFPLFWAAAACALLPTQPILLFALLAAALLRIWAACQIDGALARRFAVPRQKGLLLLLGLRDALSVTIVAASFMGRDVVWRGHVLTASGFSAQKESKQFFFEKKNQKTFAT
jgi:ceramide glucosyltransferase